MDYFNDTALSQFPAPEPIETLSASPISIDNFISWNLGQNSGPVAMAKTSDNIHGHGSHCEYPNSSTPGDASVNWNGAMKLLMLSLVSTGGSMGSIFIICAITVIDTFQVRGNIYLVSLALSHLIVTILVLPASCVAIMAGIPNDTSVCHFQWILTLACLMISVLSYAFMAVENFFGLGSLVAYDLCCTKLRILFFVFLIWFWGTGFAFTQHIYSFGPAFCANETSNEIWVPYHASVGGTAIVFPTLVTIWYFTRAVFRLKNLKVQYEANPGEDPWAYILTDESISHSNVIVYAVSFFMWAPFCVVAVINSVKPMSEDVLQTAWWLALANSCTYSFVYAFTNKDFGEAFFKLFYYCCCKSHVTFTRKGAGLRRSLANDPMGLRVHIIPGLNIYNQRTRDTPIVRTGVHSGFGHPSSGMMGYGSAASSGFGGGGGGFGVCRGPFAKFQFKGGGGAKTSSEL